MLSYNHIYHAGCAADVFKHTVLALILQHLNKKPKPYTVIDTHAGRAIYDTQDERAIKTGEAERGIKRLLRFDDARGCPDVIKPYLNIVAMYNSAPASLGDGGWMPIRFYPGSPAIAQALMRSDDRLILCELHPTEIEELKRNMALIKKMMPSLPPRGAGYSPLYTASSPSSSARAAIHLRDGYEGAIALTPPKMRRALLFIDPSYEDVWEYDKVTQTIKTVLHKWREGIIALWYPVLEKRDNARDAMLASIKDAASKGEWMDVRMTHGSEGLAMTASGMLVINPPYHLEEEATKAARFIECALGAGLRDSHQRLFNDRTLGSPIH